MDYIPSELVVLYLGLTGSKCVDYIPSELVVPGSNRVQVCGLYSL